MILERSKKKGSGITRRWIYIGVLSVVLILIIASVAIVLSLRSSYYSSAQQAIEWRVRSTLRYIPSGNSQDRIASLHGLVEDFSEKEKFEFMLVSSQGKVMMTSSGFSPSSNEPLDDYYDALESEDGLASRVGYSKNREHIIAVTQILPIPVGDVEAIRFVSSLRGVDEQLRLITMLVITVDAIVLLFTIFSGMFFIRSIVIPIGDIGDTASKIANGDYDVRIENKYNDEIGDLCSIINDMASGLSQTTRMKNEFISSISHELRTPLTSIKGWAETLSVIGAEDRENFDKGMEIIVNETERLSILVEDLLDFSRLESSMLKVRLAPLDLLPELNQALQLVEMRAKRMNLKLRLKCRYKSVMVRADKNRLRQVFTNVLDNAIKYSPAGAEIIVSVKKENGFVRISTQDHGKGIPPEDLQHITTRFFKASNSLTGSGIGLAVVKEILTTHGGDIQFDSTLGEGTTVTVSLPLLDHKKE